MDNGTDKFADTENQNCVSGVDEKVECRRILRTQGSFSSTAPELTLALSHFPFAFLQDYQGHIQKSHIIIYKILWKFFAFFRFTYVVIQFLLRPPAAADRKIAASFAAATSTKRVEIKTTAGRLERGNFSQARCLIALVWRWGNGKVQPAAAGARSLNITSHNTD